MMKKNSQKKLIKVVVLTLQLSAIVLIVYLVALPVYPTAKYKFNNLKFSKDVNFKDVEVVKKETESAIKSLPEAEYAISPNRVIITKIGVNAPIIDSQSAEYGLSKGSWRIPETSTPDKGGNTVITGHRFKYLPPNNLTFYLFHKLELDDIISVVWEEKDYFYRIKEIKIVEATDLSILDPTDEPILTLFTCDPIYSTKNRLVVIGEPI